MKAAVLHAPHQRLTIEDVSLTKPKGREVLLRTAYAGLCHSDLHFIEGLYPHPTPCVLGHESAGVVEAVGDGVTYVKPGDHVITCLSVFCGTCSQCVTGHSNLCENTDVKMLPGVSRRMTWKGGELMNQFLNLSSFGEQMLVHENSMVKIDDDIPLDRGALVGCGVMTGVGAVFNAAKVEPGATVAAIGSGGGGPSAVNGAALAGAERIIAIDRVSSKLDLARELGATDTINASNLDPVEAVRELTKGGVHYSFEALGTKDTAEQSFRMLRAGGTATIIGMVPVACHTALATAAAAPTIGNSPSPLTPAGLIIRSWSPTKIVVRSGMSALTGMTYSETFELTTRPVFGSICVASISAMPIPIVMPPSAWLRAVFILRMRPAA